MEYLMFAPRFVLTADQKVYKINLVINFYKILEILVEMAILQIYQNYAVILISSIIIRFFAYYIANKKTFKEYHWLHTVETKEKIKGVGSLMAHKIAGTVHNNTDILLLSAFLQPVQVTIYSSYNYIIKFISDLIYMIASSITASMGNVLYKDDLQKQKNIFEKINSIFIFLAMILCVSLFWVINTFIKLWIGEDKIIEMSALILMICSLYLTISVRPFMLIRDAKALYKESRIIAIAEALFNLVLSLILVKKYGITGVVFATVLATFCTSTIFYPILIYKKIFSTSFLKYFFKLVISFLICIIICFVSTYITVINSANNYLSWFIYSLIYVVIISIIIFIFNCINSKYFREFITETIKNFHSGGLK